MGLESTFGLFRMMPRELLAIDSGKTLLEANIVNGCSLAIEECSECQHPVSFMDTKVLSHAKCVHLYL